MFLFDSDIERFWNGVFIRGEDECWEWLRSCNNRGYGLFRLNGRTEKAHRVSWVLQNGLISELFEGMPACILHKCDNPPCCNPNHLFLGNRKINQKDSAIKGRQCFPRNRGEFNPHAMLTESQVCEIKALFREGKLTQEEIAGRFGVVCQIISRIKAGVCWSHV